MEIITEGNVTEGFFTSEGVPQKWMVFPDGTFGGWEWNGTEWILVEATCLHWDCCCACNGCTEHRS